jgi:hypothetical protein
VFFVAQFSNALQDLINMYAHYIGKASKLKVSNLQINKFSLKIIKFLISIYLNVGCITDWVKNDYATYLIATMEYQFCTLIHMHRIVADTFTYLVIFGTMHMNEYTYIWLLNGLCTLLI